MRREAGFAPTGPVFGLPSRNASALSEAHFHDSVKLGDLRGTRSRDVQLHFVLPSAGDLSFFAFSSSCLPFLSVSLPTWFNLRRNGIDIHSQISLAD
jgi:hypothetical protein